MSAVDGRPGRLQKDRLILKNAALAFAKHEPTGLSGFVGAVFFLVVVTLMAKDVGENLALLTDGWRAVGYEMHPWLFSPLDVGTGRQIVLLLSVATLLEVVSTRDEELLRQSGAGATARPDMPRPRRRASSFCPPAAPPDIPPSKCRSALPPRRCVSMSNVPAVFLSSAMRGFTQTRRMIRDFVTDDVGWVCNAAGGEERRMWGAPIQACLRAIDASDLYVGVFWRRAGGSMMNAYNLYATEVEYYYARSRGKPTRIFVLRPDARVPDENLGLVARALRSAGIGGTPAREKALQQFISVVLYNEQYVQHCESAGQLLEKLRGTLEHFHEQWRGGSPGSQRAPHPTERAPAESNLLPGELGRHGIRVGNHPRQMSRFGQAQAALAMRQVRAHYRRSDHAAVLAYGSDLLPAFLDAGVFERGSDLLPEWTEFTKMWTRSCLWIGFLDGRFGAMWAARAHQLAHAKMRNWPAVNEAAGLIANTLYVRASMKRARAALARDPKRREAFKASQESLLDGALAHAEWKATRVDRPSAKNYLAHVYRAQRKYGRAAEAFTDQLRFGQPSSPDARARQLARYAHALALKGKREGSGTLLTESKRRAGEAATLVEDAPLSPGAIQIRKKVANVRMLSGERAAARSSLEELHGAAAEQQLRHQVSTIRAMLSAPSMLEP